jgi:hypothetical protein
MKPGPARAAETLVRRLPQTMRFVSVAYGTGLFVDDPAVLRADCLSGGVRSAGEVATQLAIRSSTVTGLVEPLHRQGLTTVQRDPLGWRLPLLRVSLRAVRVSIPSLANAWGSTLKGWPRMTPGSRPRQAAAVSSPGWSLNGPVANCHGTPSRRPREFSRWLVPGPGSILHPLTSEPRRMKETRFPHARGVGWSRTRARRSDYALLPLPDVGATAYGYVGGRVGGLNRSWSRQAGTIGGKTART